MVIHQRFVTCGLARDWVRVYVCMFGMQKIARRDFLLVFCQGLEIRISEL